MAITAEQQTQLIEVYVASFNRAPDADGLAYWATQLEGGMELEQIARSFFVQPEAASFYPASLTTAEFVDQVYLNVLNRAADVDGKAYWVNELDTGLQDRAKFLLAIINAAKTSTNLDDQAVIANKAAAGEYFAITLGSNDVAMATDMMAMVTSDPASVDAAIAAYTPGAYTLTTETNIIESGSANDTFTATDATLDAADIIVDASTIDNDVMNLTLAAGSAAATITNVENINVALNVFAGAGAAFDATNVTGATITLGSSKLGYDGDAVVTAAAANTVIAGSNVSALTVDGINGGTVDAGSAATVTVDASATNKNGTVIVNGDVNLVAGSGTVFNNLTIDATAASTVDLTGSGTMTTAVIVEGDVDVVLDAAETQTAKTITNNLVGATLTAIVSGTTDATKWDVDDLKIDATGATLTVADGQAVTQVGALAAVTVAGSAATDTVVYNTASDVTTLTAKTSLGGVTVNLTDEVTVTTLDVAAVATTIDAAADSTITTLTSTGNIVVTGAGDLTVTNATAAASVDASDAAGKLTIDMSAAAAEVLAGAGGSDITMSTATATLAVTGGAGADVVDASALTSGTLAADLGAGNDAVVLDAPTGVIAMDGGTGSDSIVLVDGADITGAGTWAVTGFENLVVVDAAASAVVAQTADVLGSQLAGLTSLAITGPATGESDDTLVLTVTADAATTNLSGLVVADTDAISLAINGVAGTAETIVGTNADDTITAGGTAADTVSGGAGDDIFIMTSTEAVMSKITGFQAAAATSDYDTITVNAAVVVADQTVDVSNVGTIFADASAAVNAVVTNGMLTLSGLTADKALANTLAEMIDIAAFVSADTTANAIAFVFNGNTYLYEDSGADAEVMTLELTGLTSATALGTAAAANTILIA